MALLQKGYLGATPLFRNTAWFEGVELKEVSRNSRTLVTASASTNVKGAWAELIGSTASNASVLFIRVSDIGVSAQNSATLLDIALGSSGSEVAVVSNIAVGSARADSAGQGIFIPLPMKIPSGSRIAARIQSAVSGKTGQILPIAIDAGGYNDAPTSLDAIGGITASSKGISFSGASGTWVEGVASTAQAYRGVSLVISAHDSAIPSSTDVKFELGVGASGSEIVIGNQLSSFFTSESVVSELPHFFPLGRSIPAGSRLAVRHSIAADPSKYGFTLIGIP